MVSAESECFMETATGNFVCHKHLFTKEITCIIKRIPRKQDTVEYYQIYSFAGKYSRSNWEYGFIFQDINFSPPSYILFSGHTINGACPVEIL